jgi:hypothetical protein
MERDNNVNLTLLNCARLCGNVDLARGPAQVRLSPFRECLQLWRDSGKSSKIVLFAQRVRIVSNLPKIFFDAVPIKLLRYRKSNATC